MRTSRSSSFCIVSVGLGLALGFCTANWKADAGAQKSASMNQKLFRVDENASSNSFVIKPRAAHAQQNDPPVEQRYKNIQVLKGLPESQLSPAMNFMRASLGVSCAYCHVYQGGDKWEWEKDDKPAKRTARRMIQMVFDINRGNRDIFGGATVTCFTCHRGSTDPVNLPALPVPAPEGGPGGLPKASTEQLPSAAAVLEKYYQAVGGRAAGERLKTRVMKGSLIDFSGTAVPLEVHLQSPGKMLVILSGPQGTLRQGFNGVTSWVKTAEGQREMRPVQLARFRAAQQAYDVVQVKEVSTNMVVAGRERVGERDTFVVTAPPDEKQTQKLYFDTQTGLLLRIITITSTVLGPIPSQMDFEDYRDVEGVKVPFTVRQSFVDPWVGSTRKFTEIKANVPIDDAKFNPPAQK